MEALSLKGVWFTYRGSSQPAVSNINLVVSEGECVLVTGPSGSGKSTLLRLMNGLIPHFYQGDLKGTVRILGKDTRKTRPNLLATEVGTVFQFPEEQMVASKVWRDVAFGPENLMLDPEEILLRVEEALEYVGLGHLRDREVFELSGGQKQRLAIASVLAMHPRVLLMDEPTAELDPAGRERILELLLRMAEERERTIVVADHRLEGLTGLVDRIVVLDRGRIAVDAPPEEVLSSGILEDLGVEMPAHARLWRLLTERGIFLFPCPASPQALLAALKGMGRERVG